jgi:hypothetical protein
LFRFCIFQLTSEIAGTDNFQCRKFKYGTPPIAAKKSPGTTGGCATDAHGGDEELLEWDSVEQCYQAFKFLDLRLFSVVLAAKRKPDETDSSHGMRVWSAGQHRGRIRPDWEVGDST